MKKYLLATAMVLGLTFPALAEPSLMSDVRTYDKQFTMDQCRTHAHELFKKFVKEIKGTKLQSTPRGGYLHDDSTTIQIMCLPELKSVLFVVAGNGDLAGVMKMVINGFNGAAVENQPNNDGDGDDLKPNYQVPNSK